MRHNPVDEVDEGFVVVVKGVVGVGVGLEGVEVGLEVKRVM